MQQYQRSLHGKLAKRLFGLAVFIGIILSAGAYMTTRESIGMAVIERGIAGVTRFNGQYMHLFDQGLVPNRAAIQEALNEYASVVSSVASRYRLGRFVAVRFYSTRQIELARINDPTYEQIDAVENVLDGSTGLAADSDEALHQIVPIDGVPFIRVYVPLTDSRDRTVGYADAIYVLSDQSFSVLRQRTFKTMLSVFMIVLATSALLYPIIFRLCDELALAPAAQQGLKTDF